MLSLLDQPHLVASRFKNIHEEEDLVENQRPQLKFATKLGR